jgi:DNA mismatch repair ATPase MutS
MKAFLLYADRDFDPTLLLSRRDRTSHMRHREPGLDLAQGLPWNHATLRQDLGLDILLNSMARGDGFLFEAAMVALLNGVRDRDAIAYRQDVLRDCLRHGTALRQMYEIAVEALKGESKHYWPSVSRYPGGTLYHAVEVLSVFVDSLRKLRELADQNEKSFNSQGFSRLFAMLRAELSDGYFAEIDRHLKRLKFKGGVLVSAELGKGNKATGHALRRARPSDLGWIARFWPSSEGYSYSLHPRDEAGARALSELRDRGVNLVANALAQSMEHISSFFQMLRTELAFYVGCLNLYEQIERLGAPTCFPKAVNPGAEVLSFRGLYDICLAISMNGRPVGNDLDGHGKSLIVVTGANTGGKSTFMRSLGLAQLMMQAGMFVAADDLSAEIRASLLTHYKREEDSTMESGKLDEELSRMNEIVEHLHPGDMILMNESFAATNEREGSEIAMQITTALLERDIKTCYVTHLYDFAHRLHQKNQPNMIFLRAERRPDGARTFRLVQRGPEQTSYGEDLYANVFGAEERPNASARLLSHAQ